MVVTRIAGACKGARAYPQLVDGDPLEDIGLIDRTEGSLTTIVKAAAIVDNASG
jgi:hypothetical protein